MKIEIIIKAIQEQTGISWNEKTVDHLLTGDPAQDVTGIAVTMTATLKALKEALLKKCNFIITHEPLFYDHQNEVSSFAADDVYLQKKKFIEDNGISVFRFHDHWHRTPVDSIAKGMSIKLGWDSFAVSESLTTFRFTGKTLGMLTKELEEKLHTQNIRFIGDRSMAIDYVTTSWGYMCRDPAIALLKSYSNNVIVTGETREWEFVEYILDSIELGNTKGLIILGHTISEEAGIEYCADWLNSFIKGIPIEFLENRDPFNH